MSFVDLADYCREFSASFNGNQAGKEGEER